MIQRGVFLLGSNIYLQGLSLKGDGEHKHSGSQTFKRSCKDSRFINENIAQTNGGFHFNAKLEIGEKEIQSTTY
ncbi:MAG: hypothetical protein AAF193_12460, partial [Bacteroidota bacterium]